MSENAWIEWKGGECPLNSHVEIRFRDGAEVKHKIADMLHDADWQHYETDPDGDIIAYRLSGPSA